MRPADIQDTRFDFATGWYARFVGKWLFCLVLGVVLVGCQGEEKPVAVPIDRKDALPAAPVKNIGDGSPIAFKSTKGVRKGSGKLNLGEDADVIEVITYDLKADGTLELTLEGPKARGTTYAGTWTRQDDHTITLNLNSAEGNQGAEVTGTLKFMDSENPSELVLKGTAKRSGVFELNFRVSE